ncbi:MAG: FtsX-like permease family protein [Chitinophagaceae bacterium]|nr:MAG: FtsX-like permease family protein [Chitinophagaceae bacterium]
MGKSIRIDNKQDYIVSAVVKELPSNSTLQFEWLASYDVLINSMKTKDGLNDATDWSSYGPVTFAELEKSADLSAINSRLKAFILSKAADQKKEAFLFPVTDLRLYNEFSNGRATGGGRISQVNMFASIAWIILLIACINFMNLATAGSQQRAREVGVRKVLGAGRMKLVFRFMTESMLMAFMAMIAGVLIIRIALPAFNLMVEKTLVADLANPFHIAAMAGITLICGLVAGLYPSLYLSSFNPAAVLKGLQTKTGGAPYVRKGLVVLQFVVSVVFIICTITVYNQIQHIKNRNLGFNRENLIELNPFLIDYTKIVLQIKLLNRNNTISW